MRFLQYLIFTIIFSLSSVSSVFAQNTSAQQFNFNAPPQYGLTAHSAILIEASTGRVIFEKNADAQEYPASMTKMMTAILSLEMTRPDDIVHISNEAANVDGSSLYLEKGDIMLMSQLRQGMMLVSGNDAAVAIADAVSGSIPAFTNLMNKKAMEIGATHTHFANPNGLPNPSHYSTARDMAKIAAYCYRNEDFRKIVATKEKAVHWIYPNKTVTFDNTNHLLWTYPYADGIKTGYTDEAGGCLAASATRNGVTLIAIVMHTNDGLDRFSEAKELLNYGFQQVYMKSAYKKGELVKAIHIHDGETASINVSPTHDIDYPIINGQNNKDYFIKVNIPRYLTAPIKTGEKVGSIDIFYNSKKVEEVPVVADSSSNKGFSFKSLCYNLYDHLTSFFMV